MNDARSLMLVLALASLPGCSSLPVVSMPRPSATAQAEVLVYRESSFIAGGVSLAVGTGSAAFASISNSEYVVANLPSGDRDVFVQARTAEPTRVQLKLRHGTRTCLRTSSSPSTIAKVVVPITLMATGYHFYLDEVPCPSTEQLSKYKQVFVTYAGN
jgi:hypothetical protein